MVGVKPMQTGSDRGSKRKQLHESPRYRIFFMTILIMQVTIQYALHELRTILEQ